MVRDNSIRLGVLAIGVDIGVRLFNLYNLLCSASVIKNAPLGVQSGR
jgi:hypothetical protein